MFMCLAFCISSVALSIDFIDYLFVELHFQIMDYASLPHFCKREGSAKLSRHSSPDIDDCFSLDHPFHQELYNYVKQQSQNKALKIPIKLGSFHVDVPDPDPEGTMIVQTIESELHKIGDQNGVTHDDD